MGTNNIDYLNTLFETPTFSKHAGDRTFRIIRQLFNLLKTNVNDVLTSIGGDNYGYLCLLLSNPAYALIYPAPFMWSIHPGILVILPNTTVYMSATMRDQHKEALWLFIEWQNFEKALQQQLTKSIYII